MKKAIPSTPRTDIESLILTLRDQKVILATDLASIYRVRAKALNQAVKRNGERFPADFMFRLTLEEAENVQRSRSQFVTLKRGHNVKYPPYAFTEHGAIMDATVLNSPRAVQMSVFVVRAFVRMRSAFGDGRKLALLEQEFKIRLNIHEAAIVDVLQRIMKILDPPPPPPEPPPLEIGFHVREDAVPYRVRRKPTPK
jgi:hypothetical protein